MAAGGKTMRTKMLALFIWAMAAMLIFMAALHPNGTGIYVGKNRSQTHDYDSG